MMTNAEKFRKLEQDFTFSTIFDIICGNGENTAAQYSVGISRGSGSVSPPTTRRSK